MVEHVTAAIRNKNDAYDKLEAAERAALKLARAAGVAWSREDDAVRLDPSVVTLRAEYEAADRAVAAAFEAEYGIPNAPCSDIPVRAD
jgi:hypothetical protein